MPNDLDLGTFLRLTRPRQDQSSQEQPPTKRKKKGELPFEAPPEVQAPPPMETPASHPVLSSIAGAGNLFDLPGSMVRDTLALRNPFDQLLSPFSEKNRTTGRDLNRMYGLAGKEDNWGNFADGMGTEIALDPLTYLTLGVTGAGKAVATQAGGAVSKAGLNNYVKGAAKAAGKIPEPGLVQKTISKFTKKAPEASLTTRAARGLATPADILVHILEEEGMDAAKTAYSAMKKGGLTDDAMHTSVGGVIQLNAPFKSTGMKKGLPNLINKATGKDTVIDGVIGAKKFDDLHGEKLASILDDAPYTPVNPKEMAKKSRLSKIWYAIAGSKLSKIDDQGTEIEKDAVQNLKDLLATKEATKNAINKKADEAQQVAEQAAQQAEVPVEKTQVNKVLGEIKPKKPKKGREPKPAKVINQEAINFPEEKMARLNALRNHDATGNIDISEAEELSNLERELNIASRKAKPATPQELIPETPAVKEAVAKQVPVEQIPPQVAQEVPAAAPEAIAPPAKTVVPKVGALAGFNKNKIEKIKNDQGFVSALGDDVISAHGAGDAVPPPDTEFTWLPEHTGPSPAPHIRDLIEQHVYEPPRTPEGRIPLTKAISKKFRESPEYSEIIGSDHYKEAVSAAQKDAYVQNILRSIINDEPMRVDGIGANQGKFKYDLSKSDKPGHIRFTQIDEVTGKPTGHVKDVRADKDLWKYATVSEDTKDEIAKRIGTTGQPKIPAVANLDDKSVSRLESLRPYMATIARKSIADEPTINDVIQTTMSRLITKGEDIASKSDSELKKYVGRSTKNGILDVLRKSTSSKVKPAGELLDAAPAAPKSEASLDELLGGDRSFDNVVKVAKSQGMEFDDKKLKELKKGLLINEAVERNDPIEKILESAKAQGIKIGKKDRSKIEKVLTKGKQDEEAIEGLLPGHQEASQGSGSIPAPSTGSQEVGRQATQEVDQLVPPTPVSKGLPNGEIETNGLGQGRRLQDASQEGIEGRIPVSPESAAQEEIERQVGEIADGIPSESTTGLGKEAGPAVDTRPAQGMDSHTKLYNILAKQKNRIGKKAAAEIEAVMKQASHQELSDMVNERDYSDSTLFGVPDNDIHILDAANMELSKRGETPLEPLRSKIKSNSRKYYYPESSQAREEIDKILASASDRELSEISQGDKYFFNTKIGLSGKSADAVRDTAKTLLDKRRQARNTQTPIKLIKETEIANGIPLESTTGLGKEAGPAVDATPKHTADDLLKNLNVEHKDYARKILEAAAEASGENVDDYVAKRYSPASKEIPLEEMLDDAGNPVKQEAGGIKQGATRFAEDSKAIVNTFTDAHNFSTFIHEFGHVARRSLADDLNAIAEKELGVVDGKWTVEQEERFSRGLERYMRDGKAPTEGLRAVFDGIKKLMTKIYQKLKGSPIESKISKEMKTVYDSIFTPGKNVKTYAEAEKIQQTLFQATSPNLGGIDDWATNTLQSIGEVEDIIGKSAPMQAFNALFNHKYRGIMSSTVGDKVAKQVEGEEKAIQQARRDIAPFNRVWLKATALDKQHVFKSVYEETKDLPDWTPEKRIVETNRRVNNVSNKVREYIEGFTDDLPQELDDISTDFKRGIMNLKTILGKAETVPPEHLAKFLQIPIEKAALLQVRNAKDLAQAADIPIEQATMLLDGYYHNLTGLLREEHDAGIKANYLDDLFQPEYGVGRQASPVPAKTLLQGMKDLFKAIFGEENMSRFARSEKNLNKNTRAKTGIHKDPSIGEFLEPHHHHQSTRKESFRDIPLGTSMLNRLSTNEKISGVYYAQRTTDGKLAKKATDQLDGNEDPIPSINEIVEHIRSNYPEISSPLARIKSADPQKLADIRAALQVAPDQAISNDDWIKAVKEQLGPIEAADLKKELANQEILDAKLPALADVISRLDPRHASMQIPLFSNDFLGTALGRMELGRQAISAARVIQEIVSEMARPRHDVNALDFGKNVSKSIKDLYEHDITHPTVLKLLKDKDLNTPQARENILDTLRQTQKNAVDAIESNIIQNRSDILENTGYVRWKDKYGNIHSIEKKKVKGEDGKTAEAWIAKVGYDPDKQAKYGLEKPKNTIFDKMGSEGEKLGSLEEAKEWIGDSDIDSSEILHNFVLPDEHARDIEKVLKPLKIREEHGIFVNIFDKYLKFWKSMHTGVLPFLSFHVRNRISGAYANATTDALYGDTTMPWWNPKRYTQSSSQTRQIMRGDEAVEGLGGIGVLADRKFADSHGIMKRFADLNPQEQTQAIRDLSFELQLTGGRQGVAADQIGKSIEGLKTQIPGGQPVDPWTGMMTEPPPASTFDRYFNPFAQEGLAADEDKWLGSLWGSDLSRYVEGQNRMSPWLTLMKQGYSPEEAARVVKQAQVDYTKLTPTERDYLRRAFPFYSFSKGAAQHYGQELLDHPGGMTGQALQLAGSARDDNALVPEHIAETAAIPLGRSADGSDAYVSGFGLGFEDPISLAVPALSMDPQGLTREIMSRSNPLLKGLIEGGTGYSTFQRGPMGARALEDMDPTIGRTLSNIHDLRTGEQTPEAKPFISPEVEFAFGMSPLARLGTFARTVTDPRKLQNPLYLASNLGTGIKVSQVSEPARLNIESQRIARELKDAGGRNFSTPYLPEYKKEGMSPEELSQTEALLERLKAITKRRKELRIKKEKEAKKS